MRRRVALVRVVVTVGLCSLGCAGSHEGPAPRPEPEPEIEPHEATPEPPSEPSDAEARARCAPSHPEQADCPRWRLAMPEACGGDRPQPSFMNPCRCMCDRCGEDRECTNGSDGRCIELPSALLGGHEERVCVYAGDACHPARATCDTCRTYGGTIACADRREIERLERLDSH